jgi:hypothetical protein
MLYRNVRLILDLVSVHDPVAVQIPKAEPPGHGRDIQDKIVI